MQLTKLFCRGCLPASLFLIPFLAGCDALPNVSISLGSQTPSSAATTWNTVAPGIEVRSETWKSPSTAGMGDTVSIVRFNLHHVKLSVDYQPNQPLSMQ